MLRTIIIGLFLLSSTLWAENKETFPNLIIPYHSEQSLKPYKKYIQNQKVGGILLLGKYTEEKARKTCLKFHKWAEETQRPPLIIAIDQEGGRVNRIHSKNVHYPSAQIMKKRGFKAIYQQGYQTGKQLKSLGITMVLAPVLDVRTHSKDTVIGDRSYGNTPQDVSRHGLALFFGLQKSGVIAVAKHFPGHGAVETDSHSALPIDRQTKKSLYNIHRYPFQQFIQHSGPAIMVSHVLYTSIDPHLPATLSPLILKKMLRKDMQFKGLIITDDIAMKALDKYKNISQRIHLAQLAGADYIITSELPKSF